MNNIPKPSRVTRHWHESAERVLRLVLLVVEIATLIHALLLSPSGRQKRRRLASAKTR